MLKGIDFGAEALAVCCYLGISKRNHLVFAFEAKSASLCFSGAVARRHC
jgi:hypothetical protein